MSVKGISENLVAPQTNETNSLQNKFVGNSALLNNADATAVRFMTAQFVGNETRQDGLQQEAQKLIEKHTSKGWFGLSWLDNDALGKELAATIGTRPELAKAVFEQLGKTEIYTAQAMIDAAGDEQLTKAEQSETGKQLLSQTKQAFSDNIAHQKSWGELFSSKDKVAADEQRIQKIDRAATEAPKTGQTTEVQETQSGSDYNVVTEEQVKAIILPAAPKAKKAELEKNIADYTQRLNDTMKKFGVNTPLKQAAFLATMSEESIGLTTMTENPSKYGSSRLRAKGRGIIQLTGDPNYKAASERFEWGKFTVVKGKDRKERKVFTSWDLLDNPQLAAKPDYAFPIAGWFWSEQKAGKNFPTANECMGATPDPTLKDFKDASYAVNGWRKKARGEDPIGWKERVGNYERALKAFNLGDEKLFQKIQEIKSK